MQRLFLIHGRNFKPRKDELEAMWMEALRHGVKRDFGDEAVQRFDGIRKKFVYYGELSNAFLEERGKKYNEAEDLAERRATLDRLKLVKGSEFADRSTYHKNSSMFRGFREFFLDALSTPADFFGVADNAAAMLAPDMAHYWQEETKFGSEVREALTWPLRSALAAGDDVMLIGHSLGTLVAYDVLWKFCYMSEHKDVRDRALTHFVSLGSPLGNPTVQERLKGGKLKGPRRYPTNICRWSNVAAEDDYICHDETVEDDFGGMASTRVKDHRIYNLSIRDGAAHQHHGAGYLVHPVVASLVQEWMDGPEEGVAKGADIEDDEA